MTADNKCECVHFEVEDDEFPDQCICGHTSEEHAPTLEGYPGDRSVRRTRMTADNRAPRPSMEQIRIWYPRGIREGLLNYKIRTFILWILL